MAFPENRMRRLRSSEAMRKMVRRTNLNVTDLIYPLFVKAGQGLKEEISSMKDCFYFSPDSIVDEAKQIEQLGIPAVLLFGQPNLKDEIGSQAWAEDGAVQQAVRAIKIACPDLLVITDVCLCAYTSHGHCGVVTDDGKIDNDASCELLAKVALSHAQAGADIIAPSDMMDGRVAYIRQAFEENGFYDTAIMAYSAKYASAFYGPFRDVADSSPTSGDRKTYQMDPANAGEAMVEVGMDIGEGADMVMIKPATCFLDIIAIVKDAFDIPVVAYNVSGEYMMINAAADAGVLDRQAAMMEMLTSIKRAGADIIITYFAKEVASLLK